MFTLQEILFKAKTLSTMFEFEHCHGMPSGDTAYDNAL